MKNFDHYLFDEFAGAGGYGKMSSRVIQKRELGKKMRESYIKEAAPVLPSTLKIGDMLLCRANLATNNFQNSVNHGVRPVYVYGIYYKRNRVVAVDLMGGTSQIGKGRMYPSNFIAETPELMRRIATNKPSIIKPCDVITVPNKGEFFASNKLLLGSMDPGLWPDLIVRRAEAIQFAPHLKNRNNCPDITNDPDVVRKGFTFSAIPDYSVRSKEKLPDMMSSGLNREETDILSDDVVDLLARWANSCAQYHRNNECMDYTFPPMDGALENYPEARFRYWRAKAGPQCGPS